MNEDKNNYYKTKRFPYLMYTESHWIVEGVVVVPLRARNGDMWNYLFDESDLEKYLEKRRIWICGRLTDYRKRPFSLDMFGCSGRTHYVIHKNGDTMDARRKNLKLVDRASCPPKRYASFYGRDGELVGVRKEKETGKQGCWTAKVGRNLRKRFSVAKYGDREACRRACEWRCIQLELKGLLEPTWTNIPLAKCTTLTDSSTGYSIMEACVDFDWSKIERI